MIYENLKEQFNLLTEEEKNAFFVYKSRLGLAINDLKNKELIIEIYKTYQALLNNPKNFFMKRTVFKDISFDNLDTFQNSLIKIKEILKKASKKIILKGDLTVYRAISIQENEKLTSLSKENFISTSLDIKESSKFLNFSPKGKFKHYLYQINIESGANVGICPYAILAFKNGEEDLLKLTQTADQKEIFLDKENFCFEERMQTEIVLQNQVITLIIVDAYKKELEEEKKR